MYDRAVDTCLFIFYSIPDRFKTQKMCDKAFSEESFILKCYLDRYKTQKNVC